MLHDTHTNCCPCRRMRLQDGTINFEIKLTGELSTNLLSEGEAHPTHGTLVAPGVNAQHHQHLFCARLDMAVDDAQGGKGLLVSEVGVMESSSLQETLQVAVQQHAHVINQGVADGVAAQPVLVVRLELLKGVLMAPRHTHRCQLRPTLQRYGLFVDCLCCQAPSWPPQASWGGSSAVTAWHTPSCCRVSPMSHANGVQVDAVRMPRSADNPHGNGFTAEVGCSSSATHLA